MTDISADTVLDCGHVPTAQDGPRVGMGFGRTGVNGETFCYGCALLRARDAMATADDYSAYLSADGKRVTDWPGGTLGTVLESHTGGSYGHRKTYVTVRDTTGAVWYGSGPAESGTYVTLHRAKPSGRLARRYARPNGENHG